LVGEILNRNVACRLKDGLNNGALEIPHIHHSGSYLPEDGHVQESIQLRS